MSTYHKIQTVFKRDPATKHKTLIEGDFSIPEFEFLARNKWVFTEKVDGTNIRIYFKDGKVTFGGRTDRAQIPATLVERLNERFLPLVEEFSDTFRDTEVCLYGEGYGDKIQKVGGNYRSNQDFVLFDINIGGYWLQRDNLEGIAHKFDIEIVPIIGIGDLFDMVAMAREGFNSVWGPFEAEGIVARPETELNTRKGDRIITKIKCRDFRP